MKIFSAPRLDPGRIMILEDDIVVLDGRLADLIYDDGDDTAIEVYLMRKYCATATSQGCALYTQKITGCRPLAGDAYAILATQRLWRSKGSSPAEAAELSFDGMVIL